MDRVPRAGVTGAVSQPDMVMIEGWGLG